MNLPPTEMIRPLPRKTPSWLTDHVVNPTTKFLIRRGFSLRGARILSVRGRATGEWRSIPVNLLETEYGSYLVAPRGNTEWSRDLRHSGSGRLISGNQIIEFSAEEIADSAKPELFRTYLALWKGASDRFFNGIRPDAPDSQFLAVAARYPVFRILEKRSNRRV